ncbi:MAG TPA: hypothetical protein VKR55_14910 [Bradyrhizobium sp.]|uniref:hypothetical protein n=1 Tax=Bradyrhizobium sp. TaxID=376 RepID=UPI002CE002A2|nr:hypothetical protein [Bradyrhizobium sp.]HLZ03427.1 hypothetical protein [Bradyrhizobium sp.]
MRQSSDVPPKIIVPITIPRHTVDSLRSEARRRDERADELASRIITNVVTDSLFAAVLDH